MANSLHTIVYTISEIDEAARQLLAISPGIKIFAFSGDLGAGKTTLIKAICRLLGVTDHVSSPTFSLINEYRGNGNEGNAVTVYHMDWYRLRNAEEAIQAGMEDCLLKQGIYCLVEWPEQAPALLSMAHAFVTIENTGEESRTLNVDLKD